MDGIYSCLRALGRSRKSRSVRVPNLLLPVRFSFLSSPSGQSFALVLIFAFYSLKLAQAEAQYNDCLHQLIRKKRKSEKFTLRPAPRPGEYKDWWHLDIRGRLPL